ncbi:hypothetical protein V1477_003412 [Vespula maculifrons]|uniref:Uncharacterized protein n=1 Tax=Vespula maculifrons TaxID=7453 RepID=A0ABD2CVR8_VESMC
MVRKSSQLVANNSRSKITDNNKQTEKRPPVSRFNGSEGLNQLPGFTFYNSVGVKPLRADDARLAGWLGRGSGACQSLVIDNHRAMDTIRWNPIALIPSLRSYPGDKPMYKQPMSIALIFQK